MGPDSFRCSFCKAEPKRNEEGLRWLYCGKCDQLFCPACFRKKTGKEAFNFAENLPCPNSDPQHVHHAACAGAELHGDRFRKDRAFRQTSWMMWTNNWSASPLSVAPVGTRQELMGL